MFKIWAKLLDENKRIIKDMIYANPSKFSEKDFFEYLVEISKELDISTPAILSYHVANFKKFNYVKFEPRDFVESVEFSALILESATS